MSQSKQKVLIKLLMRDSAYKRQHSMINQIHLRIKTYPGALDT